MLKGNQFSRYRQTAADRNTDILFKFAHRYFGMILYHFFHRWGAFLHRSRREAPQDRTRWLEGGWEGSALRDYIYRLSEAEVLRK